MFYAHKIITVVKGMFAPEVPGMASVFCATILFLWERALGFPHSDAGNLKAAPSSQIRTLPRHTPHSSPQAQGWC